MARKSAMQVQMRARSAQSFHCWPVGADEASIGMAVAASMDLVLLTGRRPDRNLSSLHASRGNPLDERLLRQEEEQNGGRDDQHAGGHQQIPRCPTRLALKILQTQTDG